MLPIGLSCYRKHGLQILDMDFASQLCGLLIMLTLSDLYILFFLHSFEREKYCFASTSIQHLAVQYHDFVWYL